MSSKRCSSPTCTDPDTCPVTGPTNQMLARLEAGWKLSEKPGFEELAQELDRMFERTEDDCEKWGYTLLDWWMLNYAQARINRRKQDKLVRKLERKLLKAQIRIKEYELSSMRDDLDRLENPYGRY